MAKFDAYQMVTDRIIQLLESGILPWARPWSSITAHAWSRSKGVAYSFLNQCLLADPGKKYATMSELLSDVSGEWLTFKQALDAGGHVRKGEKWRQIVFFKMLPVPDRHMQDADGNPIMVEIPYLKYYTVFRIDQCEGVEQKYHTDETLHDFIADQDADEIAESYVRREGITLTHVKGYKAYYSPALDTVILPLREQFADRGEYYGTLFHELTHSTGHESRLNRLAKCAAFGSETYSTEELVAEIGSASMLATLGIETPNSFHNAAAYIQNWIKALKGDKKMVVVASARAEKALRLIAPQLAGEPTA